MSNALPFISVVVPAYNRPDGVTALLAALAEQSYPPYRFEVLICDDGSKPPLAEAIATAGQPFSVRFLRAANQGPATARNRGLNEARGTIVAFTDDDCQPGETWLEAIADAMDAGAYAVHGPTWSSCPPIEPFIHSVHIDQRHGVATANFAVRKDRLVAVEGFDETFRVPYFEDEDLSRRLAEKFGPVSWSTAMKVEHPPRRGSLAGAWRAAAYYRFLPYMQGKYPGYWADAMPGIRKRALAKTALVGLAVLPLVGAPASFGLAGVGLLAWQIKRLGSSASQAAAASTHLPIVDQLNFLLLEWLLDYRRWAAYVGGRSIAKAPMAVVEELQI